MLKFIRRLIRDLGGKINEVGRLPDGSGFATASFPLRPDHWIYGESHRPPMPFRTGTDHPYRPELERMIEQAARYGVRAATMNGKDDDFDPDALVRNVVIGMLGYYTANGLTAMGPEDAALFDPVPVPPEYKWQPQPLTAQRVRDFAADGGSQGGCAGHPDKVRETRVRSTSATPATEPGMLGWVQRLVGEGATVWWDSDVVPRSRVYPVNTLEIVGESA